MSSLTKFEAIYVKKIGSNLTFFSKFLLLCFQKKEICSEILGFKISEIQEFQFYPKYAVLY